MSVIVDVDVAEYVSDRVGNTVADWQRGGDCPGDIRDCRQHQNPASY